MARIIHELTKWGVVPEAITELTRRNAQTQALNISAQLDNGIRFLDFRAMLEYDSKEWYGLHMLMTNQPAITYLSQIKDWIVAHPTELVTLWISKHGSECATGNGAYPNVSIAEKQAFWARIETLFGDLLVDSTRSSLETTP